MNARGLIDTGALLALLDTSDRWHKRCVEAFETSQLPLATSAAVLAELFHLHSPSKAELDAAWRFLHSGAVTVLGIDDSDLPRLEEFMGKIGRMLYVLPIVRAMIETDWSREKVRPLFEQVRDHHHQITIHAIEGLLKKAGL